MHDPQVVAFEVRNPIPCRFSFYDAKPGKPRWRWIPPNGATIVGRGIHWPALVTVWHVEPGGRDALTVCGRHPDGTRDHRKRWRWHVRHWKLQVHPLQRVRRALLTRCEECGRRGSPNFSHQWGRDPRQRWWQGERGLYHRECSSLVTLRNTLDDADALARRMLDTVASGHDRVEALEWFSDTRDMPVWRAARRLRARLGANPQSVQ